MAKFKDRTGETSIASNGQKITIIKYRKNNDIDVMFDDGKNTIVKHKSYIAFQQGRITNPETKTHIGETMIAKNGQKMTIIDYRNKLDITVQFDDKNKTIVNHKAYTNFKKGRIGNPNYKWFKDVSGETAVATNGQKMTIINCQKSGDIDVQFEDGTIITHKKYNNFIKGNIANPNYKPHINETRTSNSGQKMTIIRYKSSCDIDVQFEDGTIVRHKAYKGFLKGEIANPNYFPSKRIGEKRIANNGQQMTITAYRKTNDIDVMFEDGTLVEHKSYGRFLRGSIKNPNHKLHIGETYVALNGMAMTVIDYENSKNTTVQFADATVIRHTNYNSVRTGRIPHPCRPLVGFPRIIGDMKITGIAYRIGNPNMFCECIHCREKFIMTYDEMKDHVCKPL